MGKIQYSSEAEKAYKRARKSLQQKIRRYEKKGYSVPERFKRVAYAKTDWKSQLWSDTIPFNTGFAIRLREELTLEKLKSPHSADYDFYSDKSKVRGEDNPPKLSEKAIANIGGTVFDTSTGEVLNIATLNSVHASIAEWEAQSNWSTSLAEIKEGDKNKVRNILQGAIDNLGAEQVARNIEEHAQRVNELIGEILYGSGSKEGNFENGRTQVNEDIVEFSTIVMGRSLTVEESARYTDLAESNELYN